MAGLTADPAEASASLGEVQRGRNDDGNLRRLALKKTAVTALQGLPRRVAR